MALVKCKECGKDVSTAAKACPSCGAAPPKKTGLLTWIVGGMVAWGMGSCILSQTAREQNRPASPPPTAEQLAAKAKEDADINKALAAARVIKSSTKDPASFQLESFYYFPGGAVCVEFRGKNSFGAVVPGKGVFDGGQRILSNADGNKFVALWNEVCTKAGGQERSGGVKALGAI